MWKCWMQKIYWWLCDAKSAFCGVVLVIFLNYSYRLSLNVLSSNRSKKITKRSLSCPKLNGPQATFFDLICERPVLHSIWLQSIEFLHVLKGCPFLLDPKLCHLRILDNSLIGSKQLQFRSRYSWHTKLLKCFGYQKTPPLFIHGLIQVTLPMKKKIILYMHIGASPLSLTSFGHHGFG